MSGSNDCEQEVPPRGAWTDRLTQRWVRVTGRAVDLRDHVWVDGPVGDVAGIGSDFFHRFAARTGLRVVEEGPCRGLMEDFSQLAGPNFAPGHVDPRVAAFYENTSEYDLDVWSEWCGVFRPFGGALAAIFSRRLRQLNVPLSSLDTSRGITSRVLRLVDATGRVALTAWVRELVSSGRTLYAGSYSICQVPGHAGPCVKVVFPLPNGCAVVVMRPEASHDGSLILRSVGRRFGDPGFYFYVEREPGRGWSRHVRTFQETIRVYVDDRGIARADHDLRIWGVRFLRLHYRMTRRAGA